MMNKYDMGEKVKNFDILSDRRFEWPLTIYSNVGIYHLCAGQIVLPASPPARQSRSQRKKCV